MIVAESYYIEHYGTRGMRWGVRKGSVKSRAEETGRTPRQQKEHERKVQKAKNIATVGLIAASVAGLYLTSSSGQQMMRTAVSKIPSSAKKSAETAKIINSFKDVKVSEVREVITISPKGKIKDVAANPRFVKNLAARGALKRGTSALLRGG